MLPFFSFPTRHVVWSSSSSSLDGPFRVSQFVWTIIFFMSRYYRPLFLLPLYLFPSRLLNSVGYGQDNGPAGEGVSKNNSNNNNSDPSPVFFGPFRLPFTTTTLIPHCILLWIPELLNPLLSHSNTAVQGLWVVCKSNSSSTNILSIPVDKKRGGQFRGLWLSKEEA